MIVSKDARHGRTINDLAAEGKIAPVKLHLPDGRVLDANSAWAATEYVKEHKIVGQHRITW